MTSNLVEMNRFIDTQYLVYNNKLLDNLFSSSLYLNIMNNVSSVIVDKDRVSSFTCLFDGLISSDLRIVLSLVLLKMKHKHENQRGSVVDITRALPVCFLGISYV